jgi:hypothetical protein
VHLAARGFGGRAATARLTEFKPDPDPVRLHACRVLDGLSALEESPASWPPKTPFIFPPATLGEERAIDALQRGAVDYVLKGPTWRGWRLPCAARSTKPVSGARAHSGSRTRGCAHIVRLTST